MNNMSLGKQSRYNIDTVPDEKNDEKIFYQLQRNIKQDEQNKIDNQNVIIRDDDLMIRFDEKDSERKSQIMVNLESNNEIVSPQTYQDQNSG